MTQNRTARTGTVMPPEWAPHELTWMSYPTPSNTFGPAGQPTLERARTAWSAVARTIAQYEPVRLVVHPEDVQDALDRLGSDVEILTAPLDDAWMRDAGPTFVHTSAGDVAAVDWVFNGWGAQEWAKWDQDAQLGRFVAGEAQTPVHSSDLVNEGGGFHVDGEGTVLLTETVQLDPDRNPGATRASVEEEIHRHLGTSHAIWLPRGLTRDYDGFGTRGHVDIVASFAAPGHVLLHSQQNPEHPDYQVSQQLHEILEGSVDAAGRSLRITPVPAPTVLRDEESWVDYSYINHYVLNDAVVLCAFDDPADEQAAAILADAYPGRSIELVDARDIFAFGGGIHCITQQQPRPRTGGNAAPTSEEGSA